MNLHSAICYECISSDLLTVFRLHYLYVSEGGRYKSWKRRWFILNDNCLYYFQFTTVSTHR